MRKRFYILFVTRDSDGELRKIHIPIHYVYVFLAGAVLGMLTITGIAGSYTRMLVKTARYNDLRTEKKQLESRYSRLEEAAKEKDIQVASLGSLANEVSMLYGLKSEPVIDASDTDMTEQQVAQSLDQLGLLKQTALRGGATIGISGGFGRSVTAVDWLNLASAPNLWPVEGRISSSFGSRLDPFTGEGAVHRGIDISTGYGHPVIAPADGVVSYADFMSGYGRLVVVEHGHGITTRYGHLSGFAVTDGQHVERGEVIGYVGLSGRSTGPHLHYEVWVRGTPVNPYKYLRTTMARVRRLAGD
ncbi:MAG TPA: M23 family metallopeptidase [Terriglobales bacterium]|nr:M23 family metallopeptidase [Terriglobales bacterium]